jgi:hypothetical protein
MYPVVDVDIFTQLWQQYFQPYINVWRTQSGENNREIFNIIGPERSEYNKLLQKLEGENIVGENTVRNNIKSLVLPVFPSASQQVGLYIDQLQGDELFFIGSVIKKYFSPQWSGERFICDQRDFNGIVREEIVYRLMREGSCQPLFKAIYFADVDSFTALQQVTVSQKFILALFIHSQKSRIKKIDCSKNEKLQQQLATEFTRIFDDLSLRQRLINQIHCMTPKSCQYILLLSLQCFVSSRLSEENFFKMIDYLIDFCGISLWIEHCELNRINYNFNFNFGQFERLITAIYIHIRSQMCRFLDRAAEVALQRQNKSISFCFWEYLVSQQVIRYEQVKPLYSKSKDHWFSCLKSWYPRPTTHEDFSCFDKGAVLGFFDFKIVDNIDRFAQEFQPIGSQQTNLDIDIDIERLAVEILQLEERLLRNDKFSKNKGQFMQEAYKRNYWCLTTSKLLKKPVKSQAGYSEQSDSNQPVDLECQKAILFWLKQVSCLYYDSSYPEASANNS